MIKFVWNNKYRLLSLIILVFGISIYKLKNPTIYYDSQRILDYADNVKNDFDSIEKGTATIRDRDSMDQMILNLSEIPDYYSQYIGT